MVGGHLAPEPQLRFRTARLAPEEADFRPALPLRSPPGLYGADMPKMSFAEQIKHPNWQRRRLERLDSSDWQCQDCLGTDDQLHVHHKRYLKGRLYWEYEDSDLVVLCNACHEKAHIARAFLDELISSVRLGGTGAVNAAIALLGGFAFSTYAIDSELAEKAKSFGPGKFEEGFFVGVTEIASRSQRSDFIALIHREFSEGRVEPDAHAAAAIEAWKGRP